MKGSKLNGQICVKSTKHIHVFQRMNSFVFGHLVSFPFAPASGQNCISYRIFCALRALMREWTEEWWHKMSACRRRSADLTRSVQQWWRMQSHHDPPVTMVTLIENVPGERLRNLLLAATRTPQNVLVTHQRFHALIGRITNRTSWQCTLQKDHFLAKCTCDCCHKHSWKYDCSISVAFSSGFFHLYC